MELEVLSTAGLVAERTAAVIAAEIRAGARHVCLAGGTTPMDAYALLDDLVDDWTGVHLWYGDERCVPFDDPESNHGQVRERLRAEGAEWHPMPGTLGPDDGARAYAAELGDTTIDLLLLGMGPDGHTCSLFPDHPVLRAEGVAAGVSDSPKPPPERITLTLGTVNASRRIVLLANGAGKHDALARGLGAPGEHTPISLLAREALLILADADAAGDLGGEA